MLILSMSIFIQIMEILWLFNDFKNAQNNIKWKLYFKSVFHLNQKSFNIFRVITVFAPQWLLPRVSSSSFFGFHSAAKMRKTIQRGENMKKEEILLEKCVKNCFALSVHVLVTFYSLSLLPLSLYLSLSLCTAPLVCLQGHIVSICSSYRVCWAKWSQFRALAGNLGGSGWQLATLSGIKIYGPHWKCLRLRLQWLQLFSIPLSLFSPLSSALLSCVSQCKINKAEIGSISVCACSNKSRNP